MRGSAGTTWVLSRTLFALQTKNQVPMQGGRGLHKRAGLYYDNKKLRISLSVLGQDCFHHSLEGLK